MSFVGGGSDLPVFYRKFGGAVVSTAINQFVYITVNQKFDEKIRVSYSKTEEARTVEAARCDDPMRRAELVRELLCSGPLGVDAATADALVPAVLAPVESPLWTSAEGAR